MGGYEGKNYTDASLLFVTFAIKKHPNEMEIEKAKAWQEKFVEYVKNFYDEDLQLAYVPIDLWSWTISWLIAGDKFVVWLIIDPLSKLTYWLINIDW